MTLRNLFLRNVYNFVTHCQIALLLFNTPGPFLVHSELLLPNATVSFFALCFITYVMWTQLCPFLLPLLLCRLLPLGTSSWNCHDDIALTEDLYLFVLK
uniref:Uncharacterized protein n=2 Tax=Triticinae TaxID=1648030 RepID=A0A453PR79_AEGTS